MKKLLFIVILFIPIFCYSTTEKEYLDLQIQFYQEHIVKLQYEIILTKQELQKATAKKQEIEKKEQEEKKKEDKKNEQEEKKKEDKKNEPKP